MSKQPYIWLQEHEESGKAACGCEIQNGERGPALWLCEMHEAVGVLVAACEAARNSIGSLDKPIRESFNAVLYQLDKALIASRKKGA